MEKKRRKLTVYIKQCYWHYLFRFSVVHLPIYQKADVSYISYEISRGNVKNNLNLYIFYETKRNNDKIKHSVLKIITSATTYYKYIIHITILLYHKRNVEFLVQCSSAVVDTGRRHSRLTLKSPRRQV